MIKEIYSGDSKELIGTVFFLVNLIPSISV